ncbi:TPA: hypothetical protein ACKRQV_006643 [Pseudomonas aeruginosa]|nr:hypothetical protein [Pseudomonas aeruginosa]EIU2862528.1 hypothetical protein [Pseudomonas aeruginosa]
MNTAAFPQTRKYRLALAAGVVCTCALSALFIAESQGLLNPMVLASKGCRMISKSMTAGDIDAILAGHTIHLDNPDDGYCFNPPAVATSK